MTPASLTLSHYQAASLLKARRSGAGQAQASPDLGLTTVSAALDRAGVVFPGFDPLPWDQVEAIREAENNCFSVEAGEARKIAAFSELTNRVYSLYPTASAPTMLISGIPMHRIKGSDPHRDTLAKVAALKPLAGRVLDTATGLGYTAIQAARTAEEVVTIELDPTALEIARLNPWSRELFGEPRITQLIGDSFDVVEAFEDGSFDRILHDPPTMVLAGHLYGQDFYEELYRVLRTGGRLFHYIGDPDSRQGSSQTRGVVKRLRAAGFTRIWPKPRAFGVVAQK